MDHPERKDVFAVLFWALVSLTVATIAAPVSDDCVARSFPFTPFE